MQQNGGLVKTGKTAANGYFNWRANRWAKRMSVDMGRTLMNVKSLKTVVVKRLYLPSWQSIISSIF
jgi:hypothetical protein